MAAFLRRLRLGPILNGLRFLASMPTLVRLARRSPIVHLQGWEASSVGLIATTLILATGARIVYTAHNTFERAPWALDSTRIFPALAHQTIVHTAADSKRIRGAVNVIPHGHYGSLADAADPVAPDAARRALGVPGDAVVVLLFGVLRPDKGLSDLLTAVAQTPPWRALIAGKEEGALHAAQDLLASDVLKGRVTVREGFQELDVVAQLFAAADLVALPYRQASQSGVLQLSYGFARPVAAYPVGGLAEAVIDGKTGWLCSTATPSALATVLREAAVAGREELRRRGEEGQRWARASFGWDEIAEATEAVYRTALER